MTSRRWALLAATPAALAGLSVGTHAVGAGSAAGQPVPENVLLCGMFTTGTDRFSGASSIDHPSGASSSGQTYAYTGQRCEDEQGQSGDGTYTWTIATSNIHARESGSSPQAEFGTEHGQYALSDHPRQGGFNGRVTNFDLSSADNDGDACGSRTVYYASGFQANTGGSCSPSGPGLFNTHGGAASGDHFRGDYGTVVYQYGDQTNSPCPTGSSSYCFEAVLNGQTN